MREGTHKKPQEQHARRDRIQRELTLPRFGVSLYITLHFMGESEPENTAKQFPHLGRRYAGIIHYKQTSTARYRSRPSTLPANPLAHTSIFPIVPLMVGPKVITTADVYDKAAKTMDTLRHGTYMRESSTG